jgi:RimJ/RimL family protein N-acetyltransferase
MKISLLLIVGSLIAGLIVFQVFMMKQQQKEFVFKKLTQDDIPLLLKWFKEPHVATWWPTPEKDEDIIEKFLTRIRSKDTFGYIVSTKETPIGYIQYYYIDRKNEKFSWLPTELPETTIGTDQFIGDKENIGKGYGTRFVKEFIDYLHDIEPTITTVIVDPEPENHGAIRSYEKVGFKKMGVYTTALGEQALLMRLDIQISIEKALATKKAGQFQAKDKTGQPVILEWLKTNVHEPEYADTMHMVDDVLVRSFGSSEIRYLKEHPEEVVNATENTIYEQLQPFFKNKGKDIDWVLVEEKLTSIAHLYQKQANKDAIKELADSLYFFILVKEITTKKILGFARYRIVDDSPQGTVILEPLVVAPEAQQRGLGKLLVASIFNIIPNITRILLTVESKNDVAFKAYQTWGFVEYPGSDIFHKNMGYQVEHSDILQKTTESLVAVEK